MIHTISNDKLSIDYLSKINQTSHQLKLSEASRAAILACREYVDRKIKESDSPIYGINTGFGSLYSVSISDQDLSQLQYNLIVSHACGMGNIVPQKIAKWILFLKIQSLSYGHSGISLDALQRLIDMYNANILPVMYTQGSLGASGDLAPLAHLSLPLLGLGEVYYQGTIRPSAEVLTELSWPVISLKAKDGLALLNGTQFIAGYALYIAIQAIDLQNKADDISALSLDAFDGRIEPFDPLISRIRPHAGHNAVSSRIHNRLQGSEIVVQPKVHVQDPYSFRCIPQVHGASRDGLTHFLNTLEIEINSVTDNPNVFVDEDRILSAGNFHGQPMALPLDYLSLALAEWGSISERRTYLLVSGQRNLPPYLVANPGLNSGFMIAQYTAASIVSQSKQLCSPASVDSIVSSNGQEDHVSMGANAATKCYEILQNTQRVLAIEALAAAQAIDFRKPLKTSSPNLELYNSIRNEIHFIDNDEVMYTNLNHCRDILFA